MLPRNILVVISILCSSCGFQLIVAKKLIGPLLLKLEKDINRMIEQPDEAFSDRIFLDLLYYCRSLISLNYMIDNRSESAKEIAKYLFDEGGPSFLETHVDTEMLMSVLHWKEEDIKNLQFLFEKVKLLWIEFHKTYKRNIVWFV